MEFIVSAALKGLFVLFTGEVFLALMIGICIGMVLGIIPGLGGLSGMGLLLPFAIGQPPETAFALLLGMYAVTTQTDTIPAVLIGVPGTSQAQATYLDGYPMAKNGEAGRALSASYFASIWGTVIAMAVFALLLPILREFIFSFAAPEFFILSILGLAMAGSLSGDSMLRGLVAGAFGLLIAAVGFPPESTTPRLDFGWIYLWDGIPVVPVALGTFALPEVIDLMIRRKSIANENMSASGGMLEGFMDVIRNRWLLTRTSLIGCVCGMIPGVGGTMAEWLSYGHAVQTAEDPSRFGKGDVRGVMAPESGTGAQKPGSILPTVVFGIPGNAAMALLLGAFFIVGLRPGPDMLNKDLALTFQLAWTIIAGNIIAALLCLALQRYLVRLCYIRAVIIAPVILCFMAVGASLANGEFGDLAIFFCAGILGYICKHTNWPRVPMIIGLVLGPLVEPYLFISISRYGAAWLWERPIVIAVELLLVFSLAWPRLRKYLARRADTSGERE